MMLSGYIPGAAAVEAVGRIAEELRFNLCRCGAHVEILRAVRRAAGRPSPPFDP